MKKNLLQIIKTITALFCLQFSMIGIAQNYTIPEKLPANLELSSNSPQTYSMTTEYFDYDLFGNFIKKKLITAKYTTGFENGYIKWNKVEVAESNSEKGTYTRGKEQEYMKGFTYKQSMENINQAFAERLPQADIFLKNLAWDIKAIEDFAWSTWNKLELNKEYSDSSKNSSVDLAGEGTFENKDIRFTWIGITKVNKVDCAIIKFTVMGNPLEVKTGDFNIKGRSHYWGNIYVSFLNKQIEYAELYEDVIMDVKKGEEKSNTINTVRYIHIQKNI